MSTPFAKLKISLNFPLNSYNTIKDFLDAMREIFLNRLLPIVEIPGSLL